MSPRNRVVRFVLPALFVCSVLLIGTAGAQTPAAEVAVTGAGLLSIHPVDGLFAGPDGPYLDKGLGGVSPGVAVGLNVATRQRINLLFEFGTARTEVEQRGRLVPAGRATGRLRDSMVTALVGPTVGRGRTRVQPLAGGSWLRRSLSSNDVPIDATEGELPLLLTAGLDVEHGVSPRVALVFGGRGYFFGGRSRAARELGVGKHLFRLGAGVRVRVNR